MRLTISILNLAKNCVFMAIIKLGASLKTHFAYKSYKKNIRRVRLATNNITLYMREFLFSPLLSD